MNRLVWTAAAASLALVTSPAHANTLISGFDGSQFFSSGGTVVDSTFANVGSFAAQFSELDTVADTFSGLGPDSAPFGGSFWDGSFGSDNTLVTSFTAGTFTASSFNFQGSSSEITTPFTLQMSLQGTATSLVAEGGQENGNLLGYIANDDLAVVFSGDLSSAGLVANDWFINLGANIASGSGSIGVEFSTDGTTYSPVDTFNLSAVETEFTSLTVTTPSDSATGFFRLNLPSGANIDNIAVFAEPIPEPGTALLVLTGLVGLSHASRRRS